MPGLEDLFDLSDYKKNEKGKKVSKPKETKKPEQSSLYQLPVRIRSGHIHGNLLSEEYKGETTVGEKEVKDWIRKNYPELSNIKFSLVKFSNAYTEALEKQEKEEPLRAGAFCMEEVDEEEEYAGDEELEFASAEEDLTEKEVENCEEESEEVEEEIDNHQDSNKKGCWIKLDICYQELTDEQEVTFPVYVTVGSNRMLFDKKTDSMEKIYSDWTELHPEYKGCLFHYDHEKNMLIPFMRGESEIKGKRYKLPIMIGYLHLMKNYGSVNSHEESVTETQLREKYAKQYPEFENALFVYNAEANILFPVLNFKKGETSDKYSLPMLVRGPGFKMTLEESDFKGKTAVTMQEMRAFIETVYPEFSKERTEMVYDERGFVVPILKGSRKGVVIESSRENQTLFFVTGKNGKSYRIEQTPYGVFDCGVDGKEVDFHFTAEKIPADIFNNILSFFRKKPNQEAAVQIFYDTKTKYYELYYPKQKVTRCSVAFERNPELEKKKVLVMDVHSHGCLPAFFSSVDDHDEKGTRLFLVIGNLGDTPEWKLRAGIAGFYKYLHFMDVFNMEGCLE